MAAAITLASSGEPAAHAFNGMFVVDRMAVVLKLFVYLGVAAILIYSRAYARSRQLFRGEFFALALFATLGMLVMISASHLLILYLGLELLSLSLYAMVALRRDSDTATEAAMKYFVLGALASGMLLYGMSMVYGATGSLAIADIASRVAEGKALGAILVFGLVFIVAGIGFKLGAVPFHMWVPDVYQGAPTPVTVFIGSAPELAAFALAMRLLVEALGAPGAPGGVAEHARDPGAAVHGGGQHYRHRPDQPQAHARLLGDRAHGVHAAGHPRRHARTATGRRCSTWSATC